ncbi:MAG TPA: MFS transporter [Lachnospiraceae bacterium]|nr:MFS transporter [Lachnospiraceae bacterium]
MNITQKMKALRKHPLIELLKHNKGNPRTLILMEPLWGIPYNLIAPFATLYMYTQGITDVQIGLILSIAMFVQVIFSFFGGIITDKFGRKFTTMMGDFFGWGVACLVWAISSNFWLFLIAVLFNCFEQINQTAWYCLLIEDADSKDLLGIYTWVNIGGLVAIFFAPISGLLIKSFTVVPVVRVLYIVFAVNMIIKVIITFRHCDETRQGKIRMNETKDTPVLQMLIEYKDLIPKVLRNKEIMKVLFVYVILHITNLVNINFFSLYVTQRLGIADRFLAFFPILNAAVMLIFMIGIQHRLESVKFRIPMCIGLVLYAACSMLLILTPIRSMLFIIIYVFVSAVASSLVLPRKDALLQLNINPKERARINALIMSFTIAFASPFGYFAGWLSSIDRRLPFVLTFTIYIAAIIMVGRIRDPEFTKEHREVDKSLTQTSDLNKCICTTESEMII